ncbi:MAG: hypothetical protein M1826_001931 [Phylliscum demangeonii]|nr:MAG: hypothetical protein M1826_001931 [Phylliscum demangeonii]
MPAVPMPHAGLLHHRGIPYGHAEHANQPPAPPPSWSYSATHQHPDGHANAIMNGPSLGHRMPWPYSQPLPLPPPPLAHLHPPLWPLPAPGSSPAALRPAPSTAVDRPPPPPPPPTTATPADDDAIVPSLQIPATINDSKASLAEFAAQITCLFWFESYLLLHTVETAEASPAVTTRLVPEAHPTSGFRKWATTILSTTQVTQNVIVLALLFIYRLKKLNPIVQGKSGSEFRLLTVALMLANKFLDDNTYTNKTWAEVSGISVQEIHIMEVEFLSNMKYSLFVSEREWRDWHVKLGRFWIYFDQASRVRHGLDRARRPSAPPTPTSTRSPSLPTPPASTHVSPAHYPAPSMPHPLAYPYPSALLAPSAPPTFASSPLAAIPDLASSSSSPPRSRKRSWQDGGSGPAAKRPAPAAGAGPSASGRDRRSIVVGDGRAAPGPGPYLPAPHASIGALRPVAEGYPTWHAAPPRPAGRAMSLGPMPPVTAMRPPVIPPPGAAHPGESYGVSSASYPAPPASQSHLSPSYFLTHRDSPYRPVRQVSTLLVPPRFGLMHGAPPPLPCEQMHYQPLGKSRSEYRTGVVPSMPAPPLSWPQAHPPLFPAWPTFPPANPGR